MLTPGTLPARIRKEVDAVKNELQDLPDRPDERARAMSRVLEHLDGLVETGRSSQLGDGQPPPWVSWVVHEVAKKLLDKILDICLSALTRFTRIIDGRCLPLLAT